MYPEINRFLKMLHERRISSFLVTNAQFPEAIRSLEPCTQLYVSVDASTKDSLKKIDRPLFKGKYYSQVFSLQFNTCFGLIIFFFKIFGKDLSTACALYLLKDREQSIA